MEKPPKQVYWKQHSYDGTYSIEVSNDPKCHSIHAPCKRKMVKYVREKNVRADVAFDVKALAAKGSLPSGFVLSPREALILSEVADLIAKKK